MSAKKVSGNPTTLTHEKQLLVANHQFYVGHNILVFFSSSVLLSNVNVKFEVVIVQNVNAI